MRRLIDNGNRPITPKPHIGHYGRLRKAYLEQYRHRLYTALVASEKLYPHLAETDRAARDMLDYLMQFIKAVCLYAEFQHIRPLRLRSVSCPGFQSPSYRPL